MSYNHLLEKALRFAAIAHKNQTRKSSEIPYFYHPVAVFSILQQHRYPMSWCIAALLHDTLEDTTTTKEQLRRNFGEDICLLVQQTSEPDHNNASWIERKTHTINFLRSAKVPIKIIACADKLHNLHSIKYDLDAIGDRIWEKFNEGRNKQRWYHECILDSLQSNGLSPKDHPILDEYKSLIDAVFTNSEK